MGVVSVRFELVYVVVMPSVCRFLRRVATADTGADSVVATRLNDSFWLVFRGLKPTATIVSLLRDGPTETVLMICS